MTSEQERLESGQRGLRPIPDPSLLTTEQLRHEVGALREILEARLTASDTATTLRSEQTDDQFKHLRELMIEKFTGVEKQFVERDVRVDRAATTQTTAVNAALQAQKEAAGEQNKSLTLSIDKSEAAVTKQIDALGGTIRTASDALNTQILDLKDRMARVESVALTRLDVVKEAKQTGQWVIGAALGAASLVISLIVVLTSRGA